MGQQRHCKCVILLQLGFDGRVQVQFHKIPRLKFDSLHQHLQSKYLSVSLEKLLKCHSQKRSEEKTARTLKDSHRRLVHVKMACQEDSG